MNTKLIGAAGVIAIAFFYGGYSYGSHGSSQQASAANFRAGGTMGTFTGANGGTSGGTRGARNMGGGVVAGSIITKDDQSITVKLQDGGSKIVFVSGTSQVTKNVSGDLTDLSIGTNVMVGGTPNPDGSITAQSVQIRPARTATSTTR
jgi:hypothetical protein